MSLQCIVVCKQPCGEGVSEQSVLQTIHRQKKTKSLPSLCISLQEKQKEQMLVLSAEIFQGSAYVPEVTLSANQFEDRRTQINPLVPFL